ncbi:hypothetical protein GCK72_017858 [Caenorhabditis remanei]|nr:hypothetical protein GCK72_017858 [Caenorhabditis remanei]KAF1751304.1 hypothetical protein GCK72_017858 [Caenorhabditis remanei]
MMLASLNHQLIVENFTMFYCGNQDEVMCFLPFLKPGYLKKIELVNCGTGDASLDNVMNLPQVVKAKEIKIRNIPRNRMPLESFWNIPIVHLARTNINFQEVNSLIQHYFQLDTFEYIRLSAAEMNWFPHDSPTFDDGENRKVMIVKGPKFAIKIIHQMDGGYVTLTKIPLPY